MPNLRLFTSNRLEILADELATVTGTPLSSPFDREVIVVQSRGMERWISMELALRQGVCANMEFPFPNAFMNDVLGKAFPDLTGQPFFDPDIMTWRIMEILPSLISRPGFESLMTYLEDKQVEMERTLTMLFPRLKYNGSNSRFKRAKQLEIDDFLAEFLDHPDWFKGFDEHPHIAYKWLETDLLDLVNRGKNNA